MLNEPTESQILIETVTTIVKTMATSVLLKWIVLGEANFERWDAFGAT